VPDPRARGFREEARRQAQLLRAAPEERETLDFIAASAVWNAAETAGLGRPFATPNSWTRSEFDDGAGSA
jgi:hypothetical protein